MHSKELLKSQECKKSFKDLAYFDKHKLTHKEEKAFECEESKKSFWDIVVLKSHQTAHSETKQFQCKECKFAYKSSNSLSRA